MNNVVQQIRKNEREGLIKPEIVEESESTIQADIEFYESDNKYLTFTAEEYVRWWFSKFRKKVLDQQA